MDDAEYEQQKARVEKIFSCWDQPLDLVGWHRSIVYHRTFPEQTPDSGYVRGDRGAVMETVVDWQYERARFTIYLPCVAEISTDQQLEWILLHECAHVLVNEMREARRGQGDCSKHEERVCSVLASVFQHVREAGRKDQQETQNLVGEFAWNGAPHGQNLVPNQ